MVDVEGVREWWQELAGLVLPAECGGCGRARTVLCPRCRTALCETAPFRVHPLPHPPGLPAVHAAAMYADEVRAVLLAHKERGALALARPLGAALAGAVRAGMRESGVGWGEGEGARPPGDVLLVPVPSAPAAVRARGHDPARRIALAAAGELRRAGVPARVVAVLRQRRAVADQSGLDARRRWDNLGGALAVAPGGARLLCGGPVVLVDDLVTTGASLAEAARAVRAVRAVARAEQTGTAGSPGSTGRSDTAPDTATGAGRAGLGAVSRADVEPGPDLGRGGCLRPGSGRRAEPGHRGEGGGNGEETAREVCGGGMGAVYAGFAREGRREESSGAREETIDGTDGTDGMCGAPVRPAAAAGVRGPSGAAGGAGPARPTGPSGAGPWGAGGAGVVLCAAVVAASPTL